MMGVDLVVKLGLFVGMLFKIENGVILLLLIIILILVYVFGVLVV